MIFSDIEANDKLIERLESAAYHGNIAHAYIFEGDACVDKILAANCFAKAILCEANKGKGCDSCITCIKIEHGNHEDIIYTSADGSSIKDEAIEELQGRLKKKPYAGQRNIAIIKDADTMTERAQNRLLKTLEEPPVGTVIILLSENIENLTKTILSRCVVFRWTPFLTPEYGSLLADAEELADLFLQGAPFYRAKARMMLFADNKQNAYKLLDALEIVYGKLADAKVIRSIEEARRDLQRGMNIGYTLKNMMLKIGG